jgi:uncharacterized protein
MTMNKIIIVGASSNREKFGNKAVRAYLSKGFQVFPVNPNETMIEGIACYPSVKEVPEQVETASLYVPASVGIRIIEDLPGTGVKKAYLNPGTESEAIIRRLRELGIQPLMVCSIVALGLEPSDF